MVKDKNLYRAVSFRLDNRIAEPFNDYCKSKGITRATFIREFVKNLREEKGGTENELRK